MRDYASYIEPGSPWENPWVEPYGSRMRVELLAIEQFDVLLEAQLLVADWRREYNTYRPHSALGMLTPAEFVPNGGKPANRTSHSGWTDQRGPVREATRPEQGNDHADDEDPTHVSFLRLISQGPQVREQPFCKRSRELPLISPITETQAVSAHIRHVGVEPLRYRRGRRATERGPTRSLEGKSG